MTVPRPNTNETKEILEDTTGTRWETKIDEPDKISFANALYTLDIVWNDDNWTFRLYDHANSSGSNPDPRWTQGPMHNATEVKNELPGFLPTEVCH